MKKDLMNGHAQMSARNSPDGLVVHHDVRVIGTPHRQESASIHNEPHCRCTFKL
jgi:hypothetical protein